MTKLKDMIPGGKSDNMTLSQIAKKHGVSLSDIQKEFEMGMKVESEHSDNIEKKKEVTMDHLFDNPKYYTKLKGAGLADELDESQVGELYVQIGEAIEKMDSGCEELAKLLKTPGGGPSQEFREIENIRSSILALKNLFGDGYNFNK